MLGYVKLEHLYAHNKPVDKHKDSQVFNSPYDLYTLDNDALNFFHVHDNAGGDSLYVGVFDAYVESEFCTTECQQSAIANRCIEKKGWNWWSTKSQSCTTKCIPDPESSEKGCVSNELEQRVAVFSSNRYKKSPKERDVEDETIGTNQPLIARDVEDETVIGNQQPFNERDVQGVNSIGNQQPFHARYVEDENVIVEASEASEIGGTIEPDLQEFNHPAETRMQFDNARRTETRPRRAFERAEIRHENSSSRFSGTLTLVMILTFFYLIF